MTPRIQPLVDAELIKRSRFEPTPLTETEITVAKALAAAHARVMEARRPQRSEDAAPLSPPTNNMGGTSTFPLVTENGEVLQVLERRGSGGDKAFVDWVNFTCHESSYWWDGQAVTDDQVIADVSRHCTEIFGFGISSKRDRGLNFYQTAYVLGENFGFVCHGGQRNTVLVQLSGSGCTAAKEGWEIRLQSFLKQATAARITRVDLAYDDFEGVLFNAEACEKAFDAGLFRCKFAGASPDIELHGNWKNPNGKGRTIYVGTRRNGKFFRGYEKGQQLGCKKSKWFRAEVEFKSVDREIPFDVLTRAGEYLAAAYPALNCISERQERILTSKKIVEASYDRVVGWLNKQCGSALNVLLAVEGSPEKVLSMIVREGKIPKGLDTPNYKHCGKFIHEWVREALPLGAVMEATFS